jgi:hypothetical protein
VAIVEGNKFRTEGTGELCYKKFNWMLSALMYFYRILYAQSAMNLTQL